MIKSKVTIDDAEIVLKHELCTDPNWCRDENLYIESNSRDNNTLTTIIFNDYLHIYIFWETHSSAESVEILYVSETGVIFIGCDRVSARINTKNSSLIDIDDVELFWGLDRHNDYVLETGELQCFLYSLDGKKISSAEVDPPYEMEFHDSGIKFESIVMGTTWLKFKDNC